MSNVTIPTLPVAGTLTGAELAVISQATVMSSVTLDLIAALVVPRSMPPGSIISTPQTVAPAGYIKANGALLSRATYAALWAVAQASGNITTHDSGAGNPGAGDWLVSTTPGSYSPGDGSTNFRIPDLRGIVIRSLSDGSSYDPARAIGSFQDEMVGTHAHPIAISSQAYFFGGAALSVVQPGGAINTNNNTGTETRMKNTALLACIKY